MMASKAPIFACRLGLKSKTALSVSVSLKAIFSRSFSPSIQPFPEFLGVVMTIIRATARVGLLAVTLAATGCGVWQEVAYDSLQEWQRNECQRMPDSSDRERCLNRSSTSYEDYKKQTGSQK